MTDKQIPYKEFIISLLNCDKHDLINKLHTKVAKVPSSYRTTVTEGTSTGGI